MTNTAAWTSTNIYKSFKTRKDLLHQVLQNPLLPPFLFDLNQRLSRDSALGTDVDLDSLDFGVVLESVLSQLSTETRLFETTEGHLRMKLVVTVDPNGTSLELTGDSGGSRDVGSEDSGSKTVDRVVGMFKSLLLGLKRRNNDDGAKDLLLHDFHVGGDVAENSLIEAKGIKCQHTVQSA